MNQFMTELNQVGIIPVIKIDTAENAVPLAMALQAGGLPAAEITFRSNAAEDSIRAISKSAPELCVCAGTVLNVETAKRAVDAGAKAIVSPGTNLELVRWCVKQGVPIIPGCATPTEVEACMREGLTTVKLFPAEVVGGVAMLKALAGPYSGMSFMPTGGISPSNVKDYLMLKNVVACGGSWIVPEKLLKEKRFDEIQRLAEEAAALRDTIRKGTKN